MPAHLSVKTRQAGLTSQPTSIYIEGKGAKLIAK